MQKESLRDVTDSIFFLPHTGFNVDAQVLTAVESFKNSTSVETFQNEVITKCREDLISFYWEYLKKEPILPIPLSVSKNNEIICPRYADAKLVDIVSPQEREGSVKRNIELLSKELPSASSGTAFVYTSPPGPSGFPGITYPDSQTYFFEKKGTSINAMTVVSSMTVEQNKQLVEHLTNSPFSETDNEKTLVEITGTLMSFSSLSIHELISKIEAVSGTNLDHIHAAADTNPVVDGVISNIVTNFELFVQENIADASEESQRLLKVELGKAVLSMQNVIKRGKVPLTYSDYSQSLAEVQEIGGCNGGGGFIETPFGPRDAEWGYDLEATCRLCNRFTMVGPCHICEYCVELHFSKPNQETKAKLANGNGSEENEVSTLIPLPLLLLAGISLFFSKN